MNVAYAPDILRVWHKNNNSQHWFRIDKFKQSNDIMHLIFFMINLRASLGTRTNWCNDAIYKVPHFPESKFIIRLTEIFGMHCALSQLVPFWGRCSHEEKHKMFVGWFYLDWRFCGLLQCIFSISFDRLNKIWAGSKLNSPILRISICYFGSVC